MPTGRPSFTAERMVARAALVPLLCAAALAAQVPARFTLGDSREQVRQIQGPPEVIERLTSQRIEHWRYGGATVSFDPQSGQVVAWHDPARSLRLGLRAERHTRDTLVRIGADLGDVARLLGTPWAITRKNSGTVAVLSYGRSTVEVDLATRQVRSWVRRDAALRLDPMDDSLASLAVLMPLPPRAASPPPQVHGRENEDNNAPQRTTPAATATQAPVSVPISDAPMAATRLDDALAVIIGVEQYRRLPSARFASRDAALMTRYATRTLGIPDDPVHIITRQDSSATGSEMRRLLGDNGWLARRATVNSDIVVYFAGHGAVGADGRTPLLLPADGDANYADDTGIDLHALFERLARLPARSITVIIDACFSGLARSGHALVPGTRAASVSIEHPALLRRNMAVFLASRGRQLAGEFPSERHGLFTWHLLKGLQGEADSNKDRAITVTELGVFAERAVTLAAARLDREQQPLTIARDSLRVVARLAPPR